MISSVMAARTPAEIDRPHRRPIAQIQLVTMTPSQLGCTRLHATSAPGEPDEDGAPGNGVAMEPPRRWSKPNDSKELEVVKARRAPSSRGAVNGVSGTTRGQTTLQTGESGGRIGRDGRGQTRPRPAAPGRVARRLRRPGEPPDRRRRAGRRAGSAGEPALEPDRLPLRLLRRELRQPGDDPPSPRAPRPARLRR